MLATAAVLDSRKKDKRLSQWDQAIAEVRSGKDLATITTPEEVSIGKAATSSSNIMGNQIGEYTPDTNISQKVEQSATTVRQLLSHVPVPILEAYKSTQKPSEPMTAVWDELMALCSKSVEASTNTKHVLFASNNEPTDSTDCVWTAIEKQKKHRLSNVVNGSTFNASTMPLREPQTQYELDQLEREVYALVCELWKTTSMAQNGIPTTKDGIRPVKDTTKDIKLKTKQMIQRIAPLLDGSWPAPTYQLVRAVGTQTNRESLDRSIASIIKSMW